MSSGTVRHRAFAEDLAHAIPQSCVVFTPRPLADAMAIALGDLPSAQWLDPCVGNGVFLEALAALRIPPRRIRALDTSVHRTPSDLLARTIRGEEFLAWSGRTSEKFSRIIANPPFVALNRMPKRIQEAALKVTIPGTGKPVTLGANCWFAFLCSSIQLLGCGGGLAFVLPAAWEYANYAMPLRAALPRLFEHVQAYRSREPLFRVVQEGSVVLIARGYLGAVGNARTSLQYRDHEAAQDLIVTLRGAAPSESPISSSRVHQIASTMSTAGVIQQAPLDPVITGASSALLTAKESPRPFKVGDVFRIRLGGVTGDASFFLLSEQQRVRQQLPVSTCRPVVSRAHHLYRGSLDEDQWQEMRDGGERVWLFDPKPSQISWPGVAEYLSLPHRRGGCDRRALKVRNRDPWFRTPIPTHIDGFMSGMSGWGPWVVFSEMPRLAATNTLYVVQFVATTGRDECAASAMWLLTTEMARSLQRIGRRYADGLVKYEPGDIADLPMQIPIRTGGAYADYFRAVRLLVKGHRAASRQLADSWFS